MTEILRGELEGVPLTGLLQLLESESLTGWIGIGTRGGIAMADGQVVQAAFGSLTGRTAVLEWMLEQQGTFRVERWEHVRAAPPIAPVFRLIMEGCRLLDDWTRLRHRVVQWTGDADPTETALMKLATDDTSTLEQRAQLAGMARTVAVQTVLSGTKSGVVRTISGPNTPQAPEPSASGIDYYQAMSNGRELLAAGAHAAAEEAFQQALRARPADRLATLQLNRIRVLGSVLSER